MQANIHFRKNWLTIKFDFELNTKMNSKIYGAWLLDRFRSLAQSKKSSPQKAYFERCAPKKLKFHSVDFSEALVPLAINLSILSQWAALILLDLLS